MSRLTFEQVKAVAAQLPEPIEGQRIEAEGLKFVAYRAVFKEHNFEEICWELAGDDWTPAGLILNRKRWPW